MSTKSISRREFLKKGSLTVAAVGLTAGGIAEAIPIPDPSEIELPSATFGRKIMNERILIAYASGLGSTAEIAAAIGQVLGSNGYSVDVTPMVENPPLEAYDAVVLGSAVRYGRWLPEAAAFVETNQDVLNRVPVALFTVHITTLGNDPTSRQNREAFLAEIRPLLNPIDEAFFAGKFDRRGAALMLPNWLARLIPSLDFRKWDKIQAWAESLPALLRPYFN